MGENGRRAVHTRYNWGSEAAKLGAFYDALLPDPTRFPTNARRRANT
jgi:hypothetical protein